MTKRINFEDNIFILMVRIRMIQDLLTLDADPDLFLQKTLDDFEFIGRCLELLLGNLMENQRLIEREDFLDHLSDVEWQFSQILADFLGSPGNISFLRSAAVQEQMGRLRDRSAERLKVMENTGRSTDTGLLEPVVSSMELNELLRAD
jgi:hypothetical protein